MEVSFVKRLRGSLSNGVVPASTPSISTVAPEGLLVILRVSVRHGLDRKVRRTIAVG
jgi:hypothetical protein